MKTPYFILTTLMATGLGLPAAMAATADTITTGTIKTAATPIQSQAVVNPQVAAASFVEHVNFARVALAMKNTKLATQHITQAHNMALLVQGAELTQRRVTAVESGRLVYQYETAYKYHYFPVSTGPVEVKQVSSGPMWATSNLAVTDADIVYLTLDLTGDTTEAYLVAAQAAVNMGDLTEADNQLALLTNAVVTVENQTSLPAVKARDNIALARNFIAGSNYEGASYALGHADDALDEMVKSDTYKSKRPQIMAMRKDVQALRGYIAKKDPNMMTRASKNIDKWWADLKVWANTEK